jgi:hypothetical protein
VHHHAVIVVEWKIVLTVRDRRQVHERGGSHDRRESA